MELDVRALGVDLMSASAHKIYGPKGVGMLYVRNGVKIENLIASGHQERTRRGGTTNVPGVVGFAEAFRLAAENIEANNAYVTALRDRLIDRVQAEVPDVKLNGHRTLRLPANADFSFRYIEGESVLFSLDLAGDRRFQRFGVLVRARWSRLTCCSRWGSRRSWRTVPSGSRWASTIQKRKLIIR